MRYIFLPRYKVHTYISLQEVFIHPLFNVCQAVCDGGENKRGPTYDWGGTGFEMLMNIKVTIGVMGSEAGECWASYTKWWQTVEYDGVTDSAESI